MPTHIDDMLRHMKTTMIIADDLYASVKSFAAERHRTATSVVEEALLALLRQYDNSASEQRPPFRFTGYGAGGPLPGIDLVDNAALLAAMDSPAASDVA